MWELAGKQTGDILALGFQEQSINNCGWSAFVKHTFKNLPSRLLAVFRVCRVCSHHCMKVSCWLLLTPWNNFSSFSSSSTFLLARPLNELLYKNIKMQEKKKMSLCITHTLPKSCLSEVVMFFYLGTLNQYLRLALPLLFFCVLPFLDWGGGCTASLTASSQKPMLELWVSPQILFESVPQLVQELVFTDPHTELLRDVCEYSNILLLT